MHTGIVTRVLAGGTAVVAGAALLFAPVTGAAQRQPSSVEIAFIANAEAATVALVEVTSHTITGHLVSGVYPHDNKVSGDRRRLFNTSLGGDRTSRLA